MQSGKDSEPRAVFVRSPQSQAYQETLELHRGSERFARWAARSTVRAIRAMEKWELRNDQSFLVGMCKTYKVAQEHWQLFVDIVWNVLEAERNPKEYQKRQPRLEKGLRGILTDAEGNEIDLRAGVHTASGSRGSGGWMSLKEQRERGMVV